MTVDPKCWALAEHFLEDQLNLNTEDHKRDLAETIQLAIQDWFEINGGEA